MSFGNHINNNNGGNCSAANGMPEIGIIGAGLVKVNFLLLLFFLFLFHSKI